MKNSSEVKVWDPLVRIFHWSLVIFFVVSYLTGEEESSVHIYSGYAIVGLLLVRIVWGFIGTRHARFSDFVHGGGTIIGYAKDLMRGRAKRYLGHNPLGGLMILALISSLAVTTVTGMALYGAEEGKGPLAGVVVQSPTDLVPTLISTARADDDEHEHRGHGGKGDGENEWLEEVHEFFANFTVLLVFIHLGGVIFESLYHRESLVRAMFTGNKAKPE